MKKYEVTLIDTDSNHSIKNIIANNALEAIESSFDSGKLILDSIKKPFVVVVTSESGLEIKFEVGREF